MPEIGATLREARMRARIDVSEIEARTKIRAKYLRALENEEWTLLPGPTYVKSFLRTYAQALGLDSKLLLEEYRVRHEGPSEGDLTPISTAGRGSRSRLPSRPRPSRGYVIAVGTTLVVILLLVAGLLSGGGGSSTSTPRRSAAPPPSVAPKTNAARGRRARQVTLQLSPTAPVYVCLVDSTGRKLVPGVILKPGSHASYRARRLRLTLGNSSVQMRVDGHSQPVPPSNAALGYSITARGRRPLRAGQMPTCA